MPRDLLNNIIKDVLFGLSQGYGAASQYRGSQARAAGNAAAFGAPMLRQQMILKQQQEEEERKLRMDQIRAAIAQGGNQQALAAFNAAEGSMAPEVPLSIPPALSVDPRAQGQVFQGDTQMGPQQLPAMPLGNGQMARPRSAQDIQRMALELSRSQKQPVPDQTPFVPMSNGQILDTRSGKVTGTPTEKPKIEVAPNTPFELWMKQNPNSPVSEWFKVQPKSPETQPNTPFEVWLKQHPGSPVEDYFNASSKTGGVASVAENRALSFYDRMYDAATELEPLEPNIAALGIAGQARLKYAPNMAQTPEGQRFNQAAGNFINAALRRESGAAISQSEYERFGQLYFAMPGDKPETLKQKARSRQQLLSSLKAEAGRAYKGKYGDEDEKPKPAVPTHRFNPTTGKIEAIK